VRLEKQQGKNKFKNYFMSFVPARMNPFGRVFFVPLVTYKKLVTTNTKNHKVHEDFCEDSW